MKIILVDMSKYFLINFSGFFFGSKKRKEDDEEKESIDPEKSDEKIKKESFAFTTTTKAANSKPGEYVNLNSRHAQH